jgi:hypothetical protein
MIGLIDNEKEGSKMPIVPQPQKANWKVRQMIDLDCLRSVIFK